MHLKLIQQEQLLIKLQNFQEFHHRIVRGQLEMKKKILGMMKKYLQKDIYL